MPSNPVARAAVALYITLGLPWAASLTDPPLPTGVDSSLLTQLPPLPDPPCGVIRVEAGGGGLDGAKASARAVRPPHAPNCTVAIVLASGVHTGSLHLGGADAHTQWVGEPGAVVSGGAAVSGWAQDPADPATLTAPLPSPLPSTASPRQLYIGAIRANLTVTNATLLGLTGASGAVLTDTGITTPSKAPLAWSLDQGVEFRHDSAYPQSRCRVTGVRSDANGTHVDMAQPCWSFGRLLRQMDFPSVVISAVSALSPGEWQPTKGGLRYRPQSQAERAGLLAGSLQAAVPVASVLMDIEGTSHVEVTGITFVQSAWDGPSSDDGYLERYGTVRYLRCDSEAGKATGQCFNGTQACDAGCCAAAAVGGCALSMAPAAVRIKGSTDISVTNCGFKQLGSWGVSVTRGSQRVTVARNLFTDSAAGAVYLGDVNETQSTLPFPKPAFLEVADNFVDTAGAEYQGTSGVHLFSAVSSTVQHNRIQNNPYTAMTIVWPVPQEDSFNANISVVGNDISNPSWWGGDGGAIHTLAWCHDCTLSRNYFHNQQHGTKCTYIDNGSSGYQISDHVIDDAPVSIYIYWQQCCRPECPYIAPENPYPGCNATAHDKCCCNCGTDNSATRVWVRNGEKDPFPQTNVSGLTWLSTNDSFPPEAQTIINEAGPRPAVVGPDAELPSRLVAELHDVGVATDGPSRVPLPREVDLFLCCALSAEKWSGITTGIQAHKENITGVIISPYAMSGEGVFGVQSGGAVAEQQIPELRAAGIRRVKALIAMSPGGIRQAIYNSTMAATFIAAAAARAASLNLDGFNLDAEFPNDTNETDGPAFVAFLDKFAETLHMSNRTLTVDVHGDGSEPFDFHVWGKLYATSQVDKVISMSTYTDAKLDFDRYFAECTYVLTPPKYQPGLEFNAVLSNPKDITYILSKNVTAIAVWANIPPSQVYWNAMGSFLTHPIPPTA